MANRVAGKIKLQSVDQLLGVPEISGTQEIEIVRIHAFPNHPFKVLDDERMDMLVDSIRENGILNPVIVRPDQTGDYEMISGHRRLHAAGIAGLQKIPAIVKEISIMKELDIEAGIGLIEKKRQGQGKPTMIYLKQFMIQDVQKCNNYTSGEKSVISEVKNLHILKCKNVMSRSEEFTHPEVKKLHTNKNNINNTELSNTESNHIISGNDGMGFDVEAYTEIIKENIELDILLERYPYDRELLIGIFDLILETVLCKNKSIIVASSEYPAELVRSKFLKLNMFHVEYAMDCMRKNTSKIHNIKKYLLAALFNAPSTISGYYQAEVNHDLPQYAANDK